MLKLRALVLVSLAVGATACTTTSSEEDGGASSSSGNVVLDASVPLPRCGGDPCDGVCVADIGRGTTYCAQRCSGAQACRNTSTTCTALQGETLCLLPYVAPDAGASSSSSSSSTSSTSSSGGMSSSMDVSSSGPPDAGAEDAAVTDAGGGGMDAGYSAVAWLTGRCQLGRVVLHTEKVCTASFTAVDTTLVESIALEEVQGALRLLGGGSVGSVGPGDLYSVGVVAAPEAAGTLSAQIVIRTQGGGVTRLPVNGIAATSNIATEARAVVRADSRILTAGASARPSSPVYLDGTSSFDETGAPATDFSWRLLQMPVGAPATLAAPAAGITRVVPVGSSLLAPGDYVAGLRIGDAEGRLGPEAFVSFHVQADEDLVVELTWDVPNTDMDLFLFRGDTFNVTFAAGPDACTPANCTSAQPGPRWDGANPPRTGGNPLHLGNVASGFGPERIVVGAPVAGSYVVGVRYANDNGQGPSTAVVRVLHRGRVVASARRGLTRAPGGSEWAALRVALPSVTVTPGPGPAPVFCLPRCNAGQVCMNGTCQAASGATACTADAQCPAFQACLLGRCTDLQAAPRCVTGCPAGTRCLGESVCVTDAPCSESAGPLECFGGNCNAVSGTCTAASPAACLQNACESVLMCVDGACRECTADAECGPGTLCDGASGRCVAAGCLRDADCPGGRICDARHGACLAAECSVDTECNAVDTRRVCDASSRRCFLPAAVCTGETDEPNNDVTTATDGAAAPVNGTLCRQDVDFIRIPTAPNRQLQVQVTITPSAGTQSAGVSAELRSRDGRLLSGNVLAPGQSIAELAALTGAGGELFLVLNGLGTAVDQWTYAVSVTQEAVPQCLAEPGEPNNDVGTATNSIIQPGTLDAFLCTPDDVDHHSVRLQASERLRHRLTFDPAGGGMSLTLLRANGTVLVPTVSSATQALTVDHASGNAAEQVIALVEPFGAPLTVGPRAYRLETSVTYVPNCAEDLFEAAGGGTNNNTQPFAATIPAGTHTGVLCNATDEDWFRVTLPTAGPLDVTVGWPVPDDFVDLVIRNSTAQVAASTTPQNPETIRLSSVPATSYFIQVRPRNVAGSTFRPLPYTLTVNAPSSCSDDAAEAGAGDDTRATARQLRAVADMSFMTSVTGKLCPSDADWMRLLVVRDEVVTLSVDGPAGTTAALLGTDGVTSLGSVTPGAAPLVSPAVTVPAGEYFVQVSGTNVVGTYTLNVAAAVP